MLPLNIQAIKPTICLKKECTDTAVHKEFCKKHFETERKKWKEINSSNTNILEKIYKFVKIDGSGCHVYSRGNSKYQKFCNNGVKRRVHVAVYEASKGQTPMGSHVHHTCGNQHCVNPNHMKVLTHEEHSRHHYANREICPHTGKFLKKN